jgi:hypothetical protein
MNPALESGIRNTSHAQLTHYASSKGGTCLSLRCEDEPALRIQGSDSYRDMKEELVG